MPIRDIEGFCELVKLKELDMNDSIRFSFTEDNVPTLLLEKRKGRSTTKATKSISVDSNAKLKDIISSNLSLLLYFEITNNINFREIFNTLLDVDRTIVVK